MNAFWEQMLRGPRTIAVTGHFGSGKTEFCVSLAFELAKRTDERLALADLDIENREFVSQNRAKSYQSRMAAIFFCQISNFLL